MRRKRWLKVGVVLGVFWLVSSWGILHFLVPSFILRPPRGEVLVAEPDSKATPIQWTSPDGLTLRANLHAASEPVGRFLVLHGLGDRKEAQSTLCEWLNERGFDAIAVDLRAHGESEGEYCTYGYLEKRDISSLLDTLSPDRPTFVWGASLGGAIALQAIATDERIQGGVVFSTFSSLEEIVLDRGEQIFGLEWQWVTDYLLWRCASIAGMEPLEVSPEEACRSISNPVLLAHGVLDPQIEIDYARRNYAALATADSDKVLIEVAGAGHQDVWEKGGEEFEAALQGFLAMHFGGKP